MIAQVALPLPIRKTFTYRVPSDLEPFISPFMRVKVPFAKRSLTGLAVAVGEDQEEDFLKTSDISDVIDLEPLVDPVSFELCSWGARQYYMPLGLAVKSFLPLTSDVEKYLTVHARGPDPLGVDGFRLKRAYTKAGREHVRQGYRGGLLEVRDVFTREVLKRPLERSPRSGLFSATLLCAPVEVRREQYTSLILPLLGEGQSVLMLLPDHGMIEDHFRRFFAPNLTERMLLYGSQVSAKGKSAVYFKVSRQGGYLVMGTRSCLFLPICNLGLIIVERPEDEGYRNDQTTQSNAVSLAAKRAELEKIPIWYGSVAPPLDLARRVDEGSVRFIRRESERPHLRIVTTLGINKAEKPLSELADLLAEGLASHERIVIHTPLKDYAARLYCLSCRRSVLCPVCHSMVSLQKENKLVCWKCGRQFAYHFRCRHCGGELLGFGSRGAEYAEERIKAAIPDVSVKTITGDVVRNEGIDCLAGLFDIPRTIIVGTQILSKFHDFKADRLVLIGWEEFLRITGYRTREHMYQTYANLIDALRPSAVDLLVVDRAREPAEVLGMDSEVFYREELERRRMVEFPPYVRLFLFRIDAPDSTSAEEIAKRAVGIMEKRGLRDSVVGETSVSGERGRITILIKGEDSLLDPVIDDVYRLKHLRIEADPLWV